MIVEYKQAIFILSMYYAEYMMSFSYPVENAWILTSTPFKYNSFILIHTKHLDFSPERSNHRTFSH